jgi:hypothetical protein
MSATHEEWILQLSGYIDGGLSGDDRSALEAHLAECGECRQTLADFRSVVARAGELGDMLPARDLWPGIAGAIGAPVSTRGAKVIALPTVSGAGQAPAGIFLSRPQLAAAAGILMLISAVATWTVGPGLAAVDATDVATAPAQESETRFASEAAEAPPSLAEELRSLESALGDLGNGLDPNTLHIIHRNLSVIDRAIEDSRRALALDPGSDFLEEHLVRAWERKRDYLQSAVRVVEWNG